MPGQNQIGEYKLIELAGEGSFGKVRWQSPGFFSASALPTAAAARAVMGLPARLLWLQVWKARRTGSLQTVAVKLITKHGKNEKDLRNLRQVQHPAAAWPAN